MPLITASHFLAFSAGMSPGNAVFTGVAFAPHVWASACAMSTSKPVILPLAVASSIGGKVGIRAVLECPGMLACARRSGDGEYCEDQSQGRQDGGLSALLLLD